MQPVGRPLLLQQRKRRSKRHVPPDQHPSIQVPGVYQEPRGALCQPSTAIPEAPRMPGSALSCRASSAATAPTASAGTVAAFSWMPVATAAMPLYRQERAAGMRDHDKASRTRPDVISVSRGSAIARLVEMRLAETWQARRHSRQCHGPSRTGSTKLLGGTSSYRQFAHSYDAPRLSPDLQGLPEN